MIAVTKGDFGKILLSLNYMNTRGANERKWKGLRLRSTDEPSELGRRWLTPEARLRRALRGRRPFSKRIVTRVTFISNFSHEKKYRKSFITGVISVTGRCRARCTTWVGWEMIMKQPGLDKRHRDQTGEIRKKNCNTLVKTLRKEYGEDFLKGYRPNTQLGAVLKKEGVEFLHDLVKRKR